MAVDTNSVTGATRKGGRQDATTAADGNQVDPAVVAATTKAFESGADLGGEGLIA